MNLRTLKSLLIITILFTSCTKKEAPTLEGNWEVRSIMGQSRFELAPNFKINLQTMKIAGFSGCNQFFGSVKTEKDSLSFHNMGGTRMACPDMTAENLFITTIPKVRSFEFKDNYLLFLSDAKKVLMTLKPIQEKQD
jgi:heat shock protein HslJ